MDINELLKAWSKRRWVTVFELAGAMEVSRRTVRNWWHSGHTCLIGWDCNGDARFVRFTSQSAIQFIEDNFIDPNGARPGEDD